VTYKRSKGGGSDPAGWLEYLIVIRDADVRNVITIGLIQRQPGAEFECHS
jgi:hypothetical protein